MADGSSSDEMDVGDFGDFMDECDEALEGVEIPPEKPVTKLIVQPPAPLELEVTSRPQWEAGRAEKKTVKNKKEKQCDSGSGQRCAVRDADDILGDEFEALLAAGTHTAEEVEKLKVQKRHKEELYVCRHLIQGKMWEKDPSCNERDVYLCCAAAFEGLNRQNEAIALLEGHPNFQCKLALAKLFFKADRKEESLAMCYQVIAASKEKADAVSTEDAVDAYYLAGWVKIHGDDHTGAYEIWSEGHRAIPEDPILERQNQKRQVWDEECGPSGLTDLCGEGAHHDGQFEEGDLDAYQVHPSRMRVTPALSVFDEVKQNRQVVFRTKKALLTQEECERVLKHVDDFHEKERGGVWGTVRKSSVPTTDVAVEDIPILRSAI